MSSEHPKRMEVKKKRMARCQGKNKCEAMWGRMKRKEKKTKTKRRRISVDNNLDHPGSSLIVADDVVVCRSVVSDDVVVCHILSRLPVKSLMRFKCICKRWKSIIEEDSQFINLHLSHSETRPSIFILLLKNEECRTRDYKSFLSAELHFNGRDANIYPLSKPQSFSYHKIMGPIGGLICFVDYFAVRIYNVSTREVTPWINSTVHMNVKEENNMAWEDTYRHRPHCNFGFDQTTKKHKVIFMWCQGKFQDFPVCEVLTVGDNTWRVIDELPPYLHIGSSTVSTNGSIYWKLFRLFGNDTRIKLTTESSDTEDMESSDEERDYTEWIMAFDIASEKFRMIPVPPVPKSEQDEYFFLNGFLLSEVDGCLTLIRQTDRKFKMWIFRDHNKENGTSITSSEKDWTRLSIKFPSELTVELSQSAIYIHSFSGADQIILETYKDVYDHGNKNVKAANFYCYNRKMKTLRKLEINGISSIPEDCISECSTSIESLLPVQKKL